MGKAYSDDQRLQVRNLLEAGRDEEAIEKETGVSDRTIRRWKLELERTGRIGKPPESRTGRHRVLNPEVEAALFEHVKANPDMSVDDMLWWLYDNYSLVVGTRTIRRVFERKGTQVKTGNPRDSDTRPTLDTAEAVLAVDIQDDTSPTQTSAQYQSPYAPVSAQSVGSDIESQLRQAMQHQHQQHQQQTQQHQTPQHPYPALMDLEAELPEDEETIQLQLQQIALQKREVELRLKMKKMKGGRVTPSNRKGSSSTPQSAPSSLYNPAAVMGPTPPKRDSRSKKKIQESKKRTAERQERMLRELERRSRRRDHLTAEWVKSKDIWPLRAQGMLADLMHSYGCYVYSPTTESIFDAMYRDLYQLVDLQKGDWDAPVDDEMLRERMKRKMGQLRAKMQKTGEIVPRTDGYGGFQKAENYTGEQAGAAVGDESDIVQDPALQGVGDASQAQPPGGPGGLSHEDHLQYSPVPDQQLQATAMSYPNPLMHHQSAGQYPLMDQHHPMLPYAQMDTQQALSHQENMVL